MGIKLGNGKWATKEDELLAYRVIEGKYFDRSFDFARSSTTTRVNKDGYIEVVPSDTARIDFADSVDGALLTEPASTNLITYPISFADDYWTKSGASIEPDSSTAGSELVTNNDFEDGSNDWDLESGWSIVGEKARYDASISGNTIRQLMSSIAVGKTIKLQFDISDVEVGKSAFLKIEINGIPEILLNYTLLSEGTHTYYHTITSGLDRVNFVPITSSTGGAFSIDNISVKEVQGFEAPKEIPVANGEELVTNGDMELDSDWTDYFTPTTNERSGVRAHTGTYSRHIVGNDTYDGIKQDGIAMAQNSTYVCSAWVYVESGTVTMQVRATDTFHIIGSSSSASWVKLSGHFTSNSATLNQRVAFICDGAGGEFYVDDVSVKEATSYSGGGLEREAYKLVEDTSTGEHSLASSVITVTGSADHYQSLFIKTAERTKIGLREAQNSGKYATFDLLNEVVMDENGLTAHISKLAGCWYRIDYGCNSNVWTTMKMKVHLLDDTYTTGSPSSHSYTGSGKGLYIAYAQLEEGSYASSLMLPVTEGSTTSRVADACTGSGTAQDFKDYNASGVLYAEIAANSDDGTTSRYISINDGAFNDFIQLLYLNTSNTIRAQLYVGGVMQVRIDHVVTDTTVFHKTAFRWYGNTTTAADGRFSLWIDGAMVESEDVSGLTIASGTLTTMDFDYLNGTQNFYGKTRALEVLPYMSDTEMSLLTSP